jgi:peroxiredoxin
LLEKIHELQAHLVAISPQVPQGSQLTAEKNGLTFTVLSDQGNKVANKFGLVFRVPQQVKDVYLGLGIDLAAANADQSWELPLAATYIIDRDGTIRDYFVNTDYVRRMEPADILAALERISQQGPA